jgi:hypothetical protein
MLRRKIAVTRRKFRETMPGSGGNNPKNLQRRTEKNVRRARRLTRTVAVSALKKLGFGRTAAYDALSPDGRSFPPEFGGMWRFPVTYAAARRESPCLSATRTWC